MKIGFILSIGLVFLFSVGASNCSTPLKYEDDVQFLNSGQANRSEFLAYVNDSVCKDLNGVIGLCSLQVRSDEVIRLRHPAQQYAYNLKFVCTSGTDIDFSIDVLKDAQWEFEIRPEQFKDFKLFSCRGEVYPDDRDNAMLASWNVRFQIFDTNYQEREVIYFKDGVLVVGKYAKYIEVCDENECRNYKKQPVIAMKSAPLRVRTESELMRMNYLGY